MTEYSLSHLKELEAEAIHIIREVAAEFENPVMLYSIGKDSSVMVRLAEKAFFPGKVPFPLMHIDSKWKFKEMVELWDIYNARVHKGESIRVFPISNWTELDIWQYIRLEKIPIVPLYFAKERPVVNQDGNLIMVDDERMPREIANKAELKMVRFRTLGCYPLTGAVESEADTIEKIVEEMMTVTVSERTTRVIDFDQDGSMEQKKREGYF